MTDLKQPLVLKELKEKTVISKDGLPAECNKIRVKEEYDLTDQKIYTVIFEVLDDKDAVLEERTIMYSNTTDETGNIINNYDLCKVANEQSRIDKVAKDYGWI